VNSLYGIGLCFENGQGVPKNVTEAVKWYRKAAEKGFELAKLKLAALDN
jgi:TPR repeat protein